MIGPFDMYGWFTGSFPEDCIRECSGPGDVTESVTYWQRKLGFDVPRQQAIQYLREFGAWPVKTDKYDKGLNDMSDTDLAHKVLWLACCEIRESGEWLGLVH